MTRIFSGFDTYEGGGCSMRVITVRVDADGNETTVRERVYDFSEPPDVSEWG